MIAHFFQGAGLGFSAMATPGPFQAFLLAQTLKNGWQRTLPAALAPLLSDGPIVTLMLVVLIQAPARFLDVLQVAGGFFMLYLAWGAVLALRVKAGAAPAGPEAATRNFFKAVLMNSLSPGPYIFWGLVAGPIVLKAWQQSPGLGFIFVLGFYSTLIGGNAALIILFATASRIDPRVGRALSIISAAILLAFGIYQISLGLVNIL